MNLTTCLTILCCVVICYGADSNWLYEQRKGRCTGSKLVNKDIVKPGAPYTIKTSTFSWSGENSYKINCVNILNNMDIRDGGSVRIKQGGPGYSEVVIEMQTKMGKGLNFHLEVYGELLRS